MTSRWASRGGAAGRRAGQPGVIGEQLAGKRGLAGRLSPAVEADAGDQLRAADGQMGDQLFGLDAQRGSLGREADRLRGVHHGGGVLPGGIGADQRLDARPARGGRGAVECFEKTEDKCQEPARAGGAGHLGGAIEAVEMEHGVVGWFGIPGAHPLEQIAVGFQVAETVAEGIAADGVVGGGAEAANIVIGQEAVREAALDGNGAEAVRFDQALKQAVAEDQEVFAAMEGLTKAEQIGRITEGGHETISTFIEAGGRVDGKRDRFAGDP